MPDFGLPFIESGKLGVTREACLHVGLVCDGFAFVLGFSLYARGQLHARDVLASFTTLLRICTKEAFVCRAYAHISIWIMSLFVRVYGCFMVCLVAIIASS